MAGNNALTGQDPLAGGLQPDQSTPPGQDPFAEGTGQPSQPGPPRPAPLTPEEQMYQREEQPGLLGPDTGLDTFAGRVAAGAGRAQDEIVRGTAMGALPYLAGASGAVSA